MQKVGAMIPQWYLWDAFRHLMFVDKNALGKEKAGALTPAMMFSTGTASLARLVILVQHLLHIVAPADGSYKAINDLMRE